MYVLYLGRSCPLFWQEQRRNVPYSASFCRRSLVFPAKPAKIVIFEFALFAIRAIQQFNDNNASMPCATTAICKR